MDIKDILLELGLQLTEAGNHFRALPSYRDSNNPTSLLIDRDTGRWTDFGVGESGSFHQLIAKIKGIPEKEAENIIKTKEVVLKPVVNQEKAKTRKTFNEDEVILSDKHDYWIKRGISKVILKEFKGGLCSSGKLMGRYVFPIFTSSGKIVGYAGRSISPQPIIKWKLIGAKSNWAYPLFLNHKDVSDSGEAILVESIGDALSLFEAGIRNVICLFGVAISPYLIASLLKLNPNKILIALNMDSEANAFAGEVGAQKVYDKLTRHFDANQVEVRYPTLKDFNEMLLDDPNSINEWHAGN